MVDKKYSQQLALAIDGSTLNRKQLAKRTYMAESTVGKHALGQRATDHEKKRAFAAVLKSAWLALSSARSDFGTLSFADNPRIKHDAFAATREAEKEEHERQQIWPQFSDAAIVPRRSRTRPESELVDRGLKEYAEEIGAELTAFITMAEYAEVDPQKYIDDFNKRLGG
ncbi:hypothetical protein [Lacticaseibacillus daqingensis]|uniref:hypothetical protein n=1 Tax=Lacticaseibacillus daqingensis TaxID=2486014 RepID=UPI000F7A1468|nr:hypothetical protein [Lacticaseibacillus daqingensis]